MKRELNIIIAVAVVASLSSCAVGRKMSFENKDAGPDYRTSKTATVVFQDKRKEVLEGKQKQSFCGVSKSTVQIAYNIQTQSGKPLADEFAGSVSKAYSKTGASADVLSVHINAGADSIIQLFKTGSRDRLLFFTIRKWESSVTPLFSSILYRVIFQFELNMYDKSGELLASCTAQDIVEKKQGDLGTSIKKLQAMSDDVMKEQIRLLFNNEQLKKNL